MKMLSRVGRCGEAYAVLTTSDRKDDLWLGCRSAATRDDDYEGRIVWWGEHICPFADWGFP
jgi:hypothetical protein